MTIDLSTGKKLDITYEETQERQAKIKAELQQAEEEYNQSEWEDLARHEQRMAHAY